MLTCYLEGHWPRLKSETSVPCSCQGIRNSLAHANSEPVSFYVEDDIIACPDTPQKAPLVNKLIKETVQRVACSHVEKVIGDFPSKICSLENLCHSVMELIALVVHN